MGSLDANDLLYQVEASRTYDPWPRLEAITAPVTWINSADDFINPRNFDIPQRAIDRMPKARFRLIPEVPKRAVTGRTPGRTSGRRTLPIWSHEPS